MASIELRGALSLIRPWRQSDAQPLVKHANNLNIARQLRDRFPHPYTLGHARQFIRSVAEARPITMFAIAVNDEAAGGIGFTPGTDVERYSAEIGYWLSEPFWGRGIVTEAVRLVSDYAFESCNILRLFAVPFADNAQSTRVLEKAGYALEATLRASSVKNGEPRDQTLYALVNDKWRRP
ncbi:MAG: GNAT family N-acetyltransferase [Vicinamibacterales bacterium]